MYVRNWIKYSLKAKVRFLQTTKSAISDRVFKYFRNFKHPSFHLNMSSTPVVQFHRPDIYPKNLKDLSSVVNFKIMILEEHLKILEQFFTFCFNSIIYIIPLDIYIYILFIIISSVQFKMSLLYLILLCYFT